MISEATSAIDIRPKGDYCVIGFTAMASPCEVLVRGVALAQATKLASLAHAETARIERKYSRYLAGNIVHAINTANGQTVPLDEETVRLLEYASQCYVLSGGLFDITSGILRGIWNFDGREIVPNTESIRAILERIGWDKVALTSDSIRLLPGMEIDLGGLGKEYAVDRVAQLLFEESHQPLMVNFGGDIRAISTGDHDEGWDIGIEDPSRPGTLAGMIGLSNGAVATSGVSYRHCFVNGRRLGHILNPRTGWPVDNAPKSVTVVGEYCLEAGLLSTLAMLQGEDAESFLELQNITYRCFR
jgi:FAD:protein FMN transferase